MMRFCNTGVRVETPEPTMINTALTMSVAR